MPHQIVDLVLTQRVNSLTRQAFMKNLSAPCGVVVKGIAINGERRQDASAGIFHKSIVNCGF